MNTTHNNATELNANYEGYLAEGRRLRSEAVRDSLVAISNWIKGMTTKPARTPATQDCAPTGACA